MPSLFGQQGPKRWGLIVICLSGLTPLLLLVPYLWGAYARILVFSVLLSVTLAVSYDLIGGLLGYLYLGHGVFFGFGAYATALVLAQGKPLVLALLLTACLCMPAAVLLSLPLFRLRGPVFALTSLGLLLLGGQLARNLPWLTGGAAGLSLPLNTDSMLTYGLSLMLALATISVHWRLSRSRLGLRLTTIRESEDMAESVGIDSGRSKRLALLFSAVPAALAGGLHAREISFVIPSEAFGLESSLAPLLMCLLIKPGTTWGPLLGALLLSSAQELIWTTLPHFHSSLYGVLLIVIGMQRAKQT